MGTYTFTWTGPATTVWVTGSFDNWKKVNQLDKEGDVFKKTVDLPVTSELVHYKFVVDDKWITNPDAPMKEDASGNLNNVLEPSDITPNPAAASGEKATAAAAAAAGGAAAGVAGGAAVAHHAKSDSSEMPGAFPETPAAKEPTFSVNPLPPTGGIGNPKPGDVNTNTLTSHVTLDKESYERGGAPNPSGSNAIEASQGAFGVPPVTNTMIPESSLPMGVDSARDPALPTISSAAGTGTTTAALAGQVPLEPRGVPEVVSESQEKAHVDPEASASRDALQHKEKLEQELQKKVPEEPATSESTIAGKIGAAAAGAGGVVAAGAAALGLTAGTQSAETQRDIAAQGTSAAQKTEDTVPASVVQSQHDAHVSPEASSNAEAVTEKSAVEKELLSKVPQENASGNPAPTATASTSATAPGSSVPDPVIADESTLAAIAVANQAPPAAASSAAPAGLNASAAQPAQSIATEAGQLSSTTQQPAAPTTAAATMTPKKPAADSRDVSPMTRGDGSASSPIVTTGATTQTTPGKSTVDSPTPGSADAKKKNRRSFFGRIKDKLKDK